MTLIVAVIPELNSGQALTIRRLAGRIITVVVILTNPPAGGQNHIFLEV